MKKAVELCAFVGLAAGLHLLVLGLKPQSGGASSSGSGGTALVSLEASSAALNAMIENWETPPEPIESPQPPPETPTPEAPHPDAPQQFEDTPISRPDLPDMALPDVPDRPTLSDVALPVPQKPKVQLPEPVEPPEPEQPEISALAPDKSPPPPKRPERPKQQPSEPARQQEPAPAPSAARAAQKSAGAGGGATAGEASSNAAATARKAKQQSLKAAWGATLRTRVERRKRYPRGANGAKGTAIVRFVVSRDGRLHSANLVTGSGSAALDQAALKAVTANSRFPAAPKGLTDATYTFSLAMNFNR